MDRARYGKFGGASSATFALTNDRIAERQNLDEHLVLRYAFPGIQAWRRLFGLSSLPEIRSALHRRRQTNYRQQRQQHRHRAAEQYFGATFVLQPQYVESLRTEGSSPKRPLCCRAECICALHRISSADIRSGSPGVGLHTRRHELLRSDPQCE